MVEFFLITRTSSMSSNKWVEKYFYHIWNFIPKYINLEYRPGKDDIETAREDIEMIEPPIDQ